MAGRRQAEAYLEAVRTIPGCERAYLVSTGPEFGTRESRHLNCMYQLTWRDVMNKRGFEDCVALGAWGAEWHERETFGSVMEAAPGNGFYQIPLGCLRSIDTGNLLAAGRTADGDRKAGAAIRVLEPPSRPVRPLEWRRRKSPTSAGSVCPTCNGNYLTRGKPLRPNNSPKCARNCRSVGFRPAYAARNHSSRLRMISSAWSMLCVLILTWACGTLVAALTRLIDGGRA